MSRAIKLFLGITICFQAGAAQSQAPGPAPAPPPGPAQPITGPGAPPPANVDIPLRQRSTLSPQDMMSQARDYQQRIDDVYKQMQSLVEQARQSKDVIRLNCVLDKVAQLKAHKSIVDTAVRSLAEANARRDDGAAVHEYTRITIVNQKAQVLGSEAQACVGEDLSYVGATRVDVEVNGVPPGDFTAPGTPGIPDHVIDRPPLASPYQPRP
jgi:hypothetical protein